MIRRLALMICITAVVCIGGVWSPFAAAQTAAQMSVNPNPASPGQTVTISNGPAASDTCTGSTVNVSVSDEDGTEVASDVATPDGDGNWSTVIDSGSLAPGSYTVSATCSFGRVCTDGTVSSTGTCNECTVGGSTANACVPCSDGGSATSADLCPVQTGGASTAATTLPGGIGTFLYEPATLVIVGAAEAVQLQPAFTG